MRRTLCLLLLTAACARADTPLPSAPRPDLSGVWILDRSASDDPAAAMRPRGREGAGGSGAMAGGGRGGRGGGGGGRGVGFRDPSGEDPSAGARSERPGGLEGPGQARARLTIFHAGEEFNVTDGNDLSTVFRCGAGDATVWTPRGPRVARALWEGEVLRIELRPGGDDRGAAETVTYALTGERLVVVRSLTPPGGDEPVRLRSVYVRGTD